MPQDCRFGTYFDIEIAVVLSANELNLVIKSRGL